MENVLFIRRSRPTGHTTLTYYYIIATASQQLVEKRHINCFSPKQKKKKVLSTDLVSTGCRLNYELVVVISKNKGE